MIMNKQEKKKKDDDVCNWIIPTNQLRVKIAPHY